MLKGEGLKLPPPFPQLNSFPLRVVNTTNGVETQYQRRIIHGEFVSEMAAPWSSKLSTLLLFFYVYRRFFRLYGFPNTIRKLKIACAEVRDSEKHEKFLACQRTEKTQTSAAIYLLILSYWVQILGFTNTWNMVALPFDILKVSHKKISNHPLKELETWSKSLKIWVLLGVMSSNCNVTILPHFKTFDSESDQVCHFEGTLERLTRREGCD